MVLVPPPHSHYAPLCWSRGTQSPTPRNTNGAACRWVLRHSLPAEIHHARPRPLVHCEAPLAHGSCQTRPPNSSRKHSKRSHFGRPKGRVFKAPNSVAFLHTTGCLHRRAVFVKAKQPSSLGLICLALGCLSCGIRSLPRCGMPSKRLSSVVPKPPSVMAP